MKIGDLVEYVFVNSWGSRKPTGKIGLLMQRTYLSYDKNFTKWDVCFNTGIVNITEKYLRAVK
tara:strand:- start:1034 stop:1222 length:189 start_codon:yes stop_codon:yes gene_type:complete